MPIRSPTNYPDPLLDDQQRFPSTPGGTLLRPDYIEAEGQRINQAIANRNFANLRDYTVQPEPGTAAASAGVPITVVTPSGAPFLTNNWQPQFFEQTDWNRSTGDLRNDLELDVLRERAALNRAQAEQLGLESQPRVDLLQARTAAAGAHDRFREAQDAETLQQTAGFFESLLDPNAPGIDSPEYDNFLLDKLSRNPRFAITPGGREIINKIAKGRDAHVDIQQLLKNPPAGFAPKSISLGKSPHVTFEPVEAGVKERLWKGYNLIPEQVQNAIGAQVGTVNKNNIFKGDNLGDKVHFYDDRGQPRTMDINDYLQAGGRLSPQTIAARANAPAEGQLIRAPGTAAPAASPTATPKHLGRYNPATGEFE